MISYKLAKDLKEIGFPQKIGKAYGEHLNLLTGKTEIYKKVDERSEVDDFDSFVYIPFLHELIDECGKDFGALIWDYRDKKWYAVNNDRTTVVRGIADSKEKAMVLLYLKLRKLKLNGRTKYKTKN